MKRTIAIALPLLLATCVLASETSQVSDAVEPTISELMKRVETLEKRIAELEESQTSPRSESSSPPLTYSDYMHIEPMPNAEQDNLPVPPPMGKPFRFNDQQYHLIPLETTAHSAN